MIYWMLFVISALISGTYLVTNFKSKKNDCKCNHEPDGKE